jgi:hypothetical protein
MTEGPITGDKLLYVQSVNAAKLLQDCYKAALKLHMSGDQRLSKRLHRCRLVISDEQG